MNIKRRSESRKGTKQTTAYLESKAESARRIQDRPPDLARRSRISKPSSPEPGRKIPSSSPKGSEQEAWQAWEGPIERLAWGGWGLASLEDGRRLLLRAPLALFPGEVVKARIRIKSRHAEGEVLDWIQRDPRRIEPACPWAARCGGCDLWGASHQGAELKRIMVQDLLRRQGVELPWDWRPAPEWAQRHRIQLHWDGQNLGFHARTSHDLVALDACPMAAPALSQAIPDLERELRSNHSKDTIGRWELLTGTPPEQVVSLGPSPSRDRSFRNTEYCINNAISVEHHLGDCRLRQTAGAFFQACPPWAWEAFQGIFESWDLRGETLYDLYGGGGFLTCMLRNAFQRFVLVEAFKPSAEDARINVPWAEIHAQPVETWLPSGLGRPGDLLLLDPPRSGLEPVVVEKLLSSEAFTLVLVGCDGAAFCRDLKRLQPHWELEKLAVLDLFPNTVHAEFVGKLAKSNIK